MSKIGAKFGEEILDAMGIDSTNVAGFTLDVYPDQIVTVTVVRQLEEPQLCGLMGFFARLQTEEEN